MSVRTVSADRHLVVSRAGRERLILIVRCPFCERNHSHSARPGFVTGERGAACGGRYQVQTVAQVLEVVA